ncbi:MAG: DNA (cytosine-5-)-methyltransferase [Methanobrevibacter sp.]|nr:DNA (cytosine-5-)-methyltransferase [Methanobrevibacter sp.]
MKRTVVELFAGVGGFRCGLNHVKEIDEDGKAVEDNTWDFIWANQWEPSTKSQAAYDCYVERFGFKSPKKDDIDNRDIALVNHKEDIPNHTLLVGGFPCQDYSVARSLSNEKGIEGKKGVLWWEIVKVLDAKEPPFVLLENVDRLLRSPSDQRGRDFGVMLKSFLMRGYAVEWRVINAAEYGFPQRRRRVFIFAYHKKTNYYKKMRKYLAKEIIFDEGLFANAFPIKKEYLDELTENIFSNDIVDISNNFHFHFFNAGRMFLGDIRTYKVKPNYVCKEKTLGELLEKDFDEKYIIPKEKIGKWEDAKGSKKIDRVKPNGEPYKFSEGSIAFPDKLDRSARTMLTSEGTTNRSSHIIGVDVENDIYRILTPVETERIQMFPDNWTNIESKAMTERRRYFMMGNALVVGVVERLGHYLKDIVDNEPE